MLKQIALTAYLIASGSTVYAKDYAPKDLNSNFDVKAKGVEKLLAQAKTVSGGRSLEQDGYYDYDFVSKYSIQFQGCHHVQQWNENADDEDVRLQTKRLARFRLVPFEKCDVVSPWASAKVIRDASKVFGNVNYGEYIVDLNTFVASYLEAKQEENEYLCADYESTCQANCADDDAYNGDDDAYTGCMNTCYQQYGCTGNNDDDGAMNMYDYAGCAQFDWEGAGDDDNDGDVQYYFGPSCADQGGEIRMNLFSDDTCTTLAQCGVNGQTRGSNCYTRSTGYILPGTKQSIIQDPCLACTENYISLEESIKALESGEKMDYDEYDFGAARDVCTSLYGIAGKCEDNLENGKYDYACKYIEGIQIGVSSQGFAVAVRRSLVADAAMGTLVIASTFIGMYVYYLNSLLKQPLSSR
jgi:hypothetical protein